MDVSEMLVSPSRDRIASPIALPANEAAIDSLRDLIVSKLTYATGRDPMAATDRDWFVAAALSLRDRIVDRWLTSARNDSSKNRKRVYYLSLEFLPGRLFLDSLNNSGLTEPMRLALGQLGVDLERLRAVEPDPALGNGGLGRLAACFMESMASLGIPAHGFGIRYNFGLFQQVIRDGWQHEYPENWLSLGNPWEFERPDVRYKVGFGGWVDSTQGVDGRSSAVWHPHETVFAIAYDTPVVGWRGRHANTLRLWSARAPDPLALEAFNRGDHVGALSARAQANAISQILYPSDETPAGQELRLRQEFFFSSASLQDLLHRHIQQYGELHSLPDKCAIQLNDTHPAIVVPELMRLLVDQHGLPWAEAWRITTSTISYTNHTLLPEALETWPVPLMERLLPRHMQIIYEINKLHLDSLAGSRKPEMPHSEVSVIDEGGDRRVRMGTLAFLGSHNVNGVSELHTELMRRTVFQSLHQLYPDRIVNKTNGITFRRWLFTANPHLTALLRDAIGPEVMDNPMALERLVPLADDPALHDRLIAARRTNKAALGRLVAERLEIAIDPDALIDVHIKRIHEYKRQLLNILEAVALYNAMRDQPGRDWVPRVKIFAGRAAASYRRAKLIIKLIHDVADVVNDDPAVRGLLKVVFLPDYNVSLAEAIIPAADLSEQISTAGMEASGTGNMKLALNGALTIGTLDGANLEIRDRVGAENMFTFGLTAQEVDERRRQPGPPRAFSPVLLQVLDSIGSGEFSPDEPHRYHDLLADLTGSDWFMVTADFDAYLAAQRDVVARWCDRRAWWRSSVLNTAHMGWFSSDRTIGEYAEEIWRVPVESD
ncbi:MAG TPA: glycogen/starch/alpha-glucan phosphorylase [Acetobacteraceae bacterium]|jgi:starch phosphorylase|nr:glycogen/starch/alpha-glucan phosphorylase [Acetobacteraceae bacterium]